MTGKEIVKTDGKREIVVREIVVRHRYASDGIEVSICRNGYQSTVVGVDEEMLQWLHAAIDEYFGS